MKKTLLFLISLLCLLSLLGGCKKECVHQYQSVITLQPTCTQEGEETFTCTLCQESYTQPVAVLPHSYGAGEIEKAATCSEEGIQKFACSVCGAEKTEPVEKLAHTLGEATVSKEPNCTEEGERSAICTVCGGSELVEKIPTNGVHVYANTVVRASTCTDPGEGVNTCTLCSYSEKCVYDLKPHSYGSGEVVKAATCTANGTKKLTCTVCSYVTEETVSALGHKWSGATCKTAAVCSVCNATGSKADHNYTVVEEKAASDTFAGTKVRQCSGCGAKTTKYYTKSYEFDLGYIQSTLSSYARELGFTVSYEYISNYRHTASLWVMDAERFGGPEKLIEKGKNCILAAYEDCKASPAGVGAYTLHIAVTYGQSGSLGGGSFGVKIGVTS